MENETKQNNTTRQQRIENFLLNPDKEIFNSLEQFNEAVEYIKSILGNLDLNELEKLQGEDGKTPVLGVDYLTDEDLDKIESFIQERISTSWEGYPTKEEINANIESKVSSEVAKIPRVKGDKGTPGTPGKDGSPDTAEQILAKLRSLPKNKRITVADIRGLQSEINNLKQTQEDSVKELEEIIKSIQISIPVIGNNGMTEINWGDIGGDITDQADLKAVLDDKLEDIAGLISAGTNVTITGSGTTDDPFVISATGIGSGDMLASVYDPTNVAGDAFDMDNMAEGTTNKLYTATIDSRLANTSGTNTGDQDSSDFDIKDLTDSTSLRSTWSGKQDALGFTPENVANKSTDVATDASSDTKYPSVKAVKTYADTKLAKTTDVTAIDDTGIADGQIAIFDKTNKKIKTSSKTIVTTLGADDTTIPTSKAIQDMGYGKGDVTKTGTETLTNKRITKRVGTVASSATPTINTDNYDAYTITALATNITSMTTNLSGTPTDFQSLTIRIKDNGTLRTITWGASFQDGGVKLPITTKAGKVLLVGLIYNSTDSKWTCEAVGERA